ncbi:MAG: 30S ribosomal protein S15 [Candidatus Nanohaloarchaeota archaeon QJJ-7]|nr:30S ribosomal protein S15 [Candidatus Nanohaloarchaeota archaeon QJJ-7]
MARMHSDGRGSSGSSRPVDPDTSWVIYDEDEVRELVTNLRGEDLEPSGIGRVLRDRYGVPDVQEITGDTVSEMIDQEFPEDLRSLMKKAVRIDGHLDDNPEDKSSERELSLVESRIRRLVDYYRGEEIPEDWTYNIEKARLVVE